MKMRKEKNIDLVNGSILHSLTKLSLPIMASSLLGTAYNITDMAWVGMLGAKAVAGVGVGGMYLWLSQGLVSLARMGGQVNVAQCCGREDYKKAREYAGGALQLTILFAIVFSAVCLLFTGDFIKILGIKDQVTYEYAWDYMKITCGFVIFSYMNQTLTGLFTAQGDSTTPFQANLAGLVANMILDPVLILGIGFFPRMEASGAAVATVFAQFIVMMVMLVSLLRKENEKNVLRKFPILVPTSVECFSKIVEIGLPTAIQGTLYCIFSMVITRMVAAFGPNAVATQRVGGQIESVSWNMSDGFAAALNAFVAQNYGAGKRERVKKGYDIAVRVVVAWGILITLVFILFPSPIARIFFHEEEVIKVAIGYLIVVGVGEAFLCVEITTIGALSGLGKTKICSIISVLFTGARIPMAYVLGRMIGLTGIWWALTISSMAKGIIFYITFQKVASK